MSAVGNEVVIAFKGADHESAYTVIARAIREYFKGDEEKMRIPWSRQMAEIIDDGFLDKILAQGEEMIKRNERLISEKARELRVIQVQVAGYKSRAEELTREIKENEEYLKSVYKTMDGVEEPDKVLAAAKRAYLWMLRQTDSKQLASKAFDSYLIGANIEHENLELD